MRAVSTFSGVGGLDLGLERAGVDVIAQAEVDEWRRRVLRWHWPDSVLFPDVRDVRLGQSPEGPRPGGPGTVGAGGDQPHPRRGRPDGEDRDADPQRDGGRRSRADKRGTRRERGRDGTWHSPDLLCGGFPCQDLSVAGKRRGLAGERSGLFHEFARIADELRPRWVLIENVPGLLSSADGRDFGVVLRTLGDLGMGVAWRVLDARFFGVPQRRRRVFIVGHSGGEPEPAIRALGAGGFGDSAPRDCSWQSPRPGPGGRAQGRVVGALTSTVAQLDDADTQRLVVAPTLTAPKPTHETVNGKRQDGSRQDKTPLTASAAGVRRLTPLECERLMGWPDDWTAIDGPATPDSRRYAACGDGVVANVAEWIGRGILREDAALTDAGENL